jgi:hypothetical protein
MANDLLALISDTEQDEAACREWWATATPAAKLRVWQAIQKEYKDPAMEVMSRFAQLAFSRAALEGERPQGG